MHTTLLRKFLLVFSLFFTIFSATNTHATVGLECTFDYGGTPYEWLKARNGANFVAINDSGQALTKTAGFEQKADVKGSLVGTFLDPDSLVDQTVIASYYFEREYDFALQLFLEGFNNAGDAFGHIILVNRIPKDEDGNDLPGDFGNYGNGFAFTWNRDFPIVDGDQFKDLSTLVPGLAARGQIGYETNLLFDFTNGHNFLTRQYFPDRAAERTITDFEFDVRQPEPRVAPDAILQAITSQCNSSLEIEDQVRDSNSNSEFIYKDNLVRMARPRMDVGLSRFWTWVDENGDDQLSIGSRPGEVGYELVLEIKINNTGAIDLKDFEVDVYITTSTPEGMLTSIRKNINAPSFLAAKERTEAGRLTYKAVKPGKTTFEVRVTAKDPEGNTLDVTNRRTVTVASTSPELSADLTFEDGRSSGLVRIGEAFGATLEISASEGVGNIENIRFSDLFSNAPNLEVLTAPSVPAGGYTLEPGQSLFLNWTLAARTPGPWSLDTTASGTDSFGITKSDVAKLSGNTDPIIVTITASPNPLPFDLNPTDNEILITATVKNTSDKVVDDVNIEGDVDGLTITSITDNPAVPLDLLAFTPADVAEDGKSKPVSLGKRGSETDTATYTWRMKAFNSPATLRLRTLFSGNSSGKLVTVLGEGKLDITSDVLLEWGVKSNQGTDSIPSGHVVRVDGFIKNVMEEDDEDAKDLVVMVFPNQVGNLGDGELFDINKTNTGKLDIFPLAPGEEITLKAFFQTLHSEKASSRNLVNYEIRLWTVEDDGSLKVADAGAVVKDGWSKSFNVTLTSNPPPLQNPLLDCGEGPLGIGYPPVFCGVSIGYLETFWPGIKGLFYFGASLTQEALDPRNSPVYLQTAWGAQIFGTVAAIYDSDGALLNALANEIAQDIQALPIAGLEAGKAVAQTTEAIAAELKTYFGGLHRAFRDNDYREIEYQFGRFVGSNPDLVLESLVVVKALVKIARKIPLPDTQLARAIRQQEKIKRTDDLAARIAKAEADGLSLEKALAAGDPLDFALLRKIYGIDRRDIEFLQKIAQDEQIMLTFRSRHPKSIELLRKAEAWPKPEGLKFKTINEIDIKYLGYRERGKATIELVEPPPSIKGKVGSDLEFALDEYVSGLISKHPEIADDPMLFAEIRGRLKTRNKEWNKLVPKLEALPGRKIGDIDEFDLPTSFEAGPQFKNGEAITIGAKETRRIRRKRISGAVPDPDRRYWSIEMSDPVGAAYKKDFRPVTGDTDFLGIFNADGSFILDAAKRIRIYEKLRTALDMQHGESFSFFMQNVRQEYLRCCTLGGTALVAVTPDKEVKAAYFLDKYSNIIAKKGSVRDDVPGDFVVLLGASYKLKVDLNVIGTLVARTFDEAIKPFLTRLVIYLPRFFSSYIGDGTEEAVFSRDPSTPILRAIQDEDGGDPRLQRWTENDGWQFVDAAEALRLGDLNTADMVPLSSMPDGAKAGESVLEIASLAEIGMESGLFFEAGDRVVINPGGENQEFAQVTALGSLVLAEPLQNDHLPGEFVYLMPSGETEILDSDNDGTPDHLDAFPSDPSESVDTDGDGVGNNEDTDDDNDGFSDENEIATGADPTNASDTPLLHRPQKPIILSLLADAAQPTGTFSVEVTAFSDPDEGDVSASGIEILIVDPSQSGPEAMIYQGNLGPLGLSPLRLSAATLDLDSSYEISIRHIDQSGQASEFSSAFTFKTGALDPADVVANGIQDTAELSGFFDTNNNDIDDATEGILVIANAETGNPIGIQTSKGTLSRVSTLRKTDLPEALIPLEDMPVGLIGFGIYGLTPGDTVDVTFYLTDPFDVNSHWMQKQPLDAI